mmetsp:Transcript_25209/g.80138  ORF Transcript_25209/g.80138 Transcript_25209/m.80138 type:complete len:239 (-) Transcript_25209:997-1713(-)
MHRWGSSCSSRAAGASTLYMTSAGRSTMMSLKLTRPLWRETTRMWSLWTIARLLTSRFRNMICATQPVLDGPFVVPSSLFIHTNLFTYPSLVTYKPTLMRVFTNPLLGRVGCCRCCLQHVNRLFDQHCVAIEDPTESAHSSHFRAAPCDAERRQPTHCQNGFSRPGAVTWAVAPQCQGIVFLRTSVRRSHSASRLRIRMFVAVQVRMEGKDNERCMAHSRSSWWRGFQRRFHQQACGG